MEIIRKDLSELAELSFEGDTLKKEKCLDAEKHVYLFARHSKGRLLGYELVKGIKVKNPDGNHVYAYPSSSQFGHYGFFISKKWAETDIPKYLQILTQRGQNL